MWLEAGTAARVLPTAVLAGAAWALAWVATGSTDAADWLPYAFLAGLLLAVVLAQGRAMRPLPTELGALAALVALAGWEALSLSWSAVPSLARDEALLTLFYAIALAVPLLSLRTQGDRLVALAAIGAVAGLLAVSAGLVLRFGSNQADHFYFGRLSFPISYPNAQAAVLLIGFWPAVVLAAQRGRSTLTRALALTAATAISAGWLTTQSKGGVAAIAVSAALVFAVSPLRLRLLVPVLLVVGLTAAAYDPLTAPFRSSGQDIFVSDVRNAGSAILVLTAVGCVVGIVYALGDRRLELSPPVRALVGRVTLGLVCIAAVAAVAAFFVTVGHPGRYVRDRWHDFNHVPRHETTSTHLLTLGSHRYDFWRVAFDQFESHPLAGIGSRGFGAAYLQHRRTTETPARVHSVELDALSEVGLVGLALLAGGLALAVVRLIARTRAGDPATTAAFAGGAYWLTHASIDWIWTIPACGLPFFLLLGSGTSGGERRALAPRPAVLAAAATVVVVFVGFVPPWLSARLTAHGELRWAKRLDPLAVEPYLAAAARAPSASAASAALAQAVAKEPRVVELRYDLALAYIRAREWRAARRELRVARRLDPREVIIEHALSRLPHR
jgi:O-antigen ligase/polysaccharide polymerase Wzy-like membrane protein